MGILQIAALALLVALVLLIVLVVLVVASRLDRRAAEAEPSEPLVRVDQLDPAGVPPAGPRLLVHHLPMRLAALVIAPVGREGELPPRDQLGSLIDQLVPGFRQLVDAHRPAFAQWPPQLSARGFVRTFFRQVALPGDRGRGSPWCSLAGRFEANGRPYLIGLVCRGDASNSLGELEISNSSDWLDVIHVRGLDQ